MFHIGTKELVTKRLVLRKFLLSDASEMFSNWANDPEVSKFLSWEPHGKIEVTQSVINDWVNAYENLNCYNWAIIFNNKLIGSISLLNPNDELCEAEAGYCMSKNYWGLGIMPEALSAVLKYSFNEVGFKRIYAKHDIGNPNSGKVMKKCGMQYIETANKPLALKPEEIHMCDCYEILNSNGTL